MSIPISAGTIINTTFVGDSRAAIATGIITQLLAAGWTNLSGSGTDQVLQCVSAQSMQIAVRVYDPGSGSCARLLLRNISGTKLGADTFLLPAALKTFRIIATSNSFWIMTAGNSAAREFVCGGLLWLPSWLEGVITTNCAYIMGNANNDTDTTARMCFRYQLYSRGNTGANTTLLVSDSLINLGTATNNALASLRLLGPWPAVQLTGESYPNGHRWHDDTAVAMEAHLAGGLSGTTDEPKIRGLIRDAFIVNDSFAADTIISRYGYNWLAITNAAVGTPGTDNRGTLFVRSS